MKDKQFIAFRGQLIPLEGGDKAPLRVAIVVEGLGDDQDLEALPLLKTEGERGFRIAPDRMAEDPAYVSEARWVMKAAGLAPDPLDRGAWPDSKVVAWVKEQQAAASKGLPNASGPVIGGMNPPAGAIASLYAFDPEVNRGILGRVNGIVAASSGIADAGTILADPLAKEAVIRVLPNKSPPPFLTVDGQPARRKGSALKDVGAYGVDIFVRAQIPNPGSAPRSVRVELRAPPPGEDGAQLPGHQIYNGPVEVRVGGVRVAGAATRAKVLQPPAGSSEGKRALIATIQIPAGADADVEVKAVTHANSQWPVDFAFVAA